MFLDYIIGLCKSKFLTQKAFNKHSDFVKEGNVENQWVV